jgi:hypothetical protein
MQVDPEILTAIRTECPLDWSTSGTGCDRVTTLFLQSDWLEAGTGIVITDQSCGTKIEVDRSDANTVLTYVCDASISCSSGVLTHTVKYRTITLPNWAIISTGSADSGGNECV